MELRLIREPSENRATIGSLYVNDRWSCWTLEDEIRERSGSVAAWKVPGETAIPAGRYRVVLNTSPRFGADSPLLVDVPGFTHVRIHVGNWVRDTEGCILVGRRRGFASVLDSRTAYTDLQAALKRAEAEIWITIENPLQWSPTA